MSTPEPDFQALVTASEAWPVFERRLLAAEKEVIASFRIFDLDTKLRSEEARAIGHDWSDLLVHILEKGVRVHMILTDFDPVMAPELHSMAWKSNRQLDQVRDRVGPDAPLEVTLALHPARVGRLPKTVFAPWVWMRQRQARKQIRNPEVAPGLHSSNLPDLVPAIHHQKLTVIDDEWLYIGGLDLNERRFDDLIHSNPASQTWADVQVMVRGPEARQARHHLDSFLSVVAGEAEPPDTGDIRRTLSAPRHFQFPYLSPRSVATEIEEDHLEGFRQAEQSIYIETQYLRSSVIGAGLAEAGKSNPDLSLILVLPVAPDDYLFEDNDGMDARYGMALQTREVTRVQEVFGSRATFASPVRPVMASRDHKTTLSGSPVIHVHSKVLIVDDRFAHVGSANLNGRSMRWDSEASLRITDRARIEHLRDKLFQHWWFEPLPQEARDPRIRQGWWDREVKRNGVRRPENRKGFLIPHRPEVTRNIEQRLPGVTEDVV